MRVAMSGALWPTFSVHKDRNSDGSDSALRRWARELQCESGKFGPVGFMPEARFGIEKAG
jgi:hypothetical protein